MTKNRVTFALLSTTVDTAALVNLTKKEKTPREPQMKTNFKFIASIVLGFGLATGPAASALAGNDVLLGPIRDEFPFQVEDYNDCTGEMILWDAVLSTFDFVHVTGNAGQQTVHSLSQFRWTARIEGYMTGFEWETKGGGKDIIKYDPTDGMPFSEVFIENSILKPITPGAPRINFSALIRFKTDDSGEVVVDFARYEYECIGN